MSTNIFTKPITQVAAVFIISASVLAFASTPVVEAQINQDRINNAKSTISAGRAALAEGRIQKCENVETNISTKIARFDNNKQRHIDQYNLIKDKTQNLINEVESQTDTTTLESYLQTLDTKIQKFATDSTTLINTLRTSQTYACGESEGQFRSTMQQARGELKIIREDSIDTRNFVQTTLRPEIQKVRDALKA